MQGENLKSYVFRTVSLDSKSDLDNVAEVRFCRTSISLFFFDVDQSKVLLFYLEHQKDGRFKKD